MLKVCLKTQWAGAWRPPNQSVRCGTSRAYFFLKDVFTLGALTFGLKLVFARKF